MGSNRYEGIDPTVVQIIRNRVRHHVWKYKFSPADVDDLMQELHIKLLESLKSFDANRGNWAAFITSLVDNGLLSILEYRQAKKRDHRMTRSLGDLQDQSDNQTSPGQTVFNHEAYLRQTSGSSRASMEHLDCAIDLQRAFDVLPEELRLICELLGCENITETAANLRMHRSTVHERIKDIRLVFEAMGLDGYLSRRHFCGVSGRT